MQGGQCAAAAPSRSTRRCAGRCGRRCPRQPGPGAPGTTRPRRWRWHGPGRRRPRAPRPTDQRGPVAPSHRGRAPAIARRSDRATGWAGVPVSATRRPTHARVPARLRPPAVAGPATRTPADPSAERIRPGPPGAPPPHGRDPGAALVPSGHRPGRVLLVRTAGPAAGCGRSAAVHDLERRHRASPPSTVPSSRQPLRRCRD